MKNYEKGIQRFLDVKEQLKGYVSDLSSKEVYQLMKKHYMTLCLISKEGHWASPELQSISDILLPGELDGSGCCEFLDEIAVANMENEYLMYFFSQGKFSEYSTLKQKLETEGKKILPDVIGYALMLQRLTKACADDWKVFASMFYIYRKARQEKKAFDVLPLFHKIKLMSVDKPCEKNYILAHKTRVIKPTAGGIAVAINILEATIADSRKKNKGNAKAGWILAKNKCGLKKADTLTGAGPSRWSADGKKIQRCYPLPKKWADLYQTWNMNFVTRFGDFPYLLPKLLIPQVAHVIDQPENYIYHRAIALIIYLNYAGFDYIEKQEKGQKAIDWYDDRLNKEWGKCNGKMAQQYERDLQDAKSTKRYAKVNTRDIKNT